MPWSVTDKYYCASCGHRWVPVVEEGTNYVRCLSCGLLNYIGDTPPSPIHFTISRIGEEIHINVNRPVERIYLAGLVAEGLSLLTLSEKSVMYPEDGSREVIVTHLPIEKEE